MTFHDYWYQKQRANPALNSEGKLTLSIESFRKEIEKAFQAGKREGVHEASKLASSPNPFFGLFGGKF